MRIPHFRTAALASLFLLWAWPALAQWYEEDELPIAEKQILNPFSFKGFNMGSGGEISTWIAPGTDPKQFELGMLARGGYKFSSMPLYLGLELPFGYASVGDNLSEFVFGNVGLGIKGRVDPSMEGVDVFTGWSFDIYLPTAWVSNSLSKATAYGLLPLTNLFPGLFDPESITLVGTFDLMLPGEYLYFQFELAGAGIFPITHTDTRNITGAVVVGAVFGVHIIKQLAWLLEVKSYSPFNVKDPVTHAEAPTNLFFSTGFRMEFGPFTPAVWVAFPTNSEYHDAFPDVIIGVNLGCWF